MSADREVEAALTQREQFDVYLQSQRSTLDDAPTQDFLRPDECAMSLSFYDAKGQFLATSNGFSACDWDLNPTHVYVDTTLAQFKVYDAPIDQGGRHIASSPQLPHLDWNRQRRTARVLVDRNHRGASPCFQIYTSMPNSPQQPPPMYQDHIRFLSHQLQPRIMRIARLPSIEKSMFMVRFIDSGDSQMGTQILRCIGWDNVPIEATWDSVRKKWTMRAPYDNTQPIRMDSTVRLLDMQGARIQLTIDSDSQQFIVDDTDVVNIIREMGEYEDDFERPDPACSTVSILSWWPKESTRGAPQTNTPIYPGGSNRPIQPGSQQQQQCAERPFGLTGKFELQRAQVTLTSQRDATKAPLYKPF